ncbi:MAG: hypothetical protein WC840_06580 [Candidatus Peribacteraceae bacterium]
MIAEQAEASSVTDEYAEYREQAGEIGLLSARELHELYENMVQETQGDPWQMEKIARAIGLPIHILHEIAENRERLRQAAEGGGSVDWNRGHLRVILPRGRPPSKKLLPARPKPAEQTNPVPLPPGQTIIAPLSPPPLKAESENTPTIPPIPDESPFPASHRYRNVFEAIQEVRHDEDFSPRTGEDFVPTDAPPGSDERIEIYAERMRNGFPMHHPEDVDGYDGRTGTSGASKRRIA